MPIIQEHHMYILQAHSFSSEMNRTSDLEKLLAKYKTSFSSCHIQADGSKEHYVLLFLCIQLYSCPGLIIHDDQEVICELSELFDRESLPEEMKMKDRLRKRS